MVTVNNEELTERIKEVLAEGVPQITITDPSASVPQSVQIVPGSIIVNDERTRPVPNGLEFITPFNGGTEDLQEKLNEVIATINQMTGA